MLLPTEIRSNLQLISEVFTPLIGKRLLDVGCGSGSLIGALLKQGAVAAGVDRSVKAISLARARFPEANTYLGDASSLPFADAAFDGAILLNSLNPLSPEAIESALQESLRVVKTRGKILIIEGLAAARPVPVRSSDVDSSEAIRSPFAAIDHFLATGRASEILRLEYVTRRQVEAEVASTSEILSADVKGDARARLRTATLYSRLLRPQRDSAPSRQRMIACILTRP